MAVGPTSQAERPCPSAAEVVAVAPAAGVIGRLDRWLAVHRPAYYAGLRPGLSERRVAALERAVGYTFPGPFRAFYRWRDGQGPDAEGPFIHNFHFMPGEAVRGAWELLAGFAADGTFDRPQWYHRGWVPFLDNGAGSHVCLDLHGSFTGRRGQVIEFWAHDPDRPVVAPTFLAWLRWFVDSLEAGRWWLDPKFGNFEEVTDVPPLPGYPITGDAGRPSGRAGLRR